MSSEEEKFCKDCNHCKFNFFALRRECDHPDVGLRQINRVNGKKTVMRLACEDLRRADRVQCGTSGRLFEPKGVTIKSKIKAKLINLIEKI